MKHIQSLLEGAEAEVKDMAERRDKAIANFRYSEAERYETRRGEHLGYCSIFRYLLREDKAAAEEPTP